VLLEHVVNEGYPLPLYFVDHAPGCDAIGDIPVIMLDKINIDECSIFLLSSQIFEESMRTRIQQKWGDQAYCLPCVLSHDSEKIGSDFRDIFCDELMRGLFSHQTENVLETVYGETKFELRSMFLQDTRWLDVETVAVLTDKIARIDFNDLELVYSLLSDTYSRNIFIAVLAYRMLGPTHIRMPIYSDIIRFAAKVGATVADKGSGLSYTTSTHKVWQLYRYDFRPWGKNYEVFGGKLGLLYAFDFFYCYRGNDTIIGPAANDVVIDAGGCWGDTALYFADRVGAGGKVVSFEMEKNNLKIFDKNLQINPHLAERIVLVTKPLWSKEGVQVSTTVNGPGTQLEERSSGESQPLYTVTIDNEVTRQRIEKIDFIKMDIEGAELEALQGAENSIRRWRPKLAISLYHKVDDIYRIPLWIHRLGLGYRFYVGHYAIIDRETVLFCECDEWKK
jgi:FkbM family methyltransferase